MAAKIAICNADCGESGQTKFSPPKTTNLTTVQDWNIATNLFVVRFTDSGLKFFVFSTLPAGSGELFRHQKIKNKKSPSKTVKFAKFRRIISQ